MPRKVKYINENMHVPAYQVWYNAMKAIDWKQPIVLIGRTKNGDLFVSSTDSGKIANSLLAKAMNFLKIN